MCKKINLHFQRNMSLNANTSSMGNPPMESRLIYSNSENSPVRALGISNRNLYVDNHEYFESEFDQPSYHEDGPRHSYDPWRDIYLKGNLDNRRFVNLERRKSDRKSTNYLEYEEYDYDDGEEDDDEDKRYVRKPSKKKNNRKRKRPMKDHRQRVKSRPYEYEDPESYENSLLSKDKGSSHADQLQQTPTTLTRRVTDVLTPFSGGILTVIAVLAVPFLIAAGYWLLVVNGPTPVVKARIDDPDFDGKISFEEENPGKWINIKSIESQKILIHKFQVSKVCWNHFSDQQCQISKHY